MEQNEAGRDYRKMIFIFLAIVFVVIISVIAWEAYKESQLPQKAAELQQQIDQEREQERQRLMADTHGGKTPQETLRMYIEAVEKGDYELASKYFIEEKRDEEIASFNGSTAQKLTNYIEYLEQASKKEGLFNLDQNYFSIDEPILIRMQLHPNGVWKIIEI